MCMATRCVTYPIRVHLCVSVVRRQVRRVDKPVGACHPQVRKRYIPVPLLTITAVGERV